MRRLLVIALLCALAASPDTAAATRHQKHAHRRTGHHRVKRRSRQRTGKITQRTWLSGVQVTEYYAVPEAWFKGRRVAAPGLPDAHRVDFLYSAAGLAIEGDGVDLQGRAVHVAGVSGVGFVDHAGNRTSTAPAWVSGSYWLSSARALTFPLEAGGWSSGVGISYRAPPAQLTFAPGQSRALTPYRSLAVDPKLIPLGSRVYIPAYVGLDGASGWFVAEDTGGAVRGRHVDVYRTAPAAPDGARNLSGQRILVEPPGAAHRSPAGGTAVPARYRG